MTNIAPHHPSLALSSKRANEQTSKYANTQTSQISDIHDAAFEGRAGGCQRDNRGSRVFADPERVRRSLACETKGVWTRKGGVSLCARRILHHPGVFKQAQACVDFRGNEQDWAGPTYMYPALFRTLKKQRRRRREKGKQKRKKGCVCAWGGGGGGLFTRPSIANTIAIATAKARLPTVCVLSAGLARLHFRDAHQALGDALGAPARLDEVLGAAVGIRRAGRCFHGAPTAVVATTRYLGVGARPRALASLAKVALLCVQHHVGAQECIQCRAWAYSLL
jgi:hypothetical protein